MDLTMSEDQETLLRTAREFLENECPPSLIREVEPTEKGYSEPLWKQMADLGWLGLMYPENYGGAGLTLGEGVVLMEEIGRAILPSPYFSTVILSGLVILEAGSEAQKNEYLPAIARGEKILSPAFLEESITYEPDGVTLKVTTINGIDYYLDGIKLFAHNAHIADRILVAARTSYTGLPSHGVTLFLIDPKSQGLTITQTETLAGDKQFELAFNNVRVTRDNVIGEWDNGWAPLSKVIQQATVLQCAEIIGCGERVREWSLEFAKTRVQYGRPIGFYQAIQHKCVSMIRNITGARALTYVAAGAAVQGVPIARRQVAVAKAYCSDTAHFIAYEGHQIFAGIGYMESHDMQLYSRRLKAMEFSMGDGDYHRSLLADEVAETGLSLETLWPA
ncbi:MAG: acyl-CoA/acyl-ACP dehydrogenase [Candidatus Tectomicrobia bacterium]|nr:acyl-CoA/acyl-ACP dehydrogenase [Candidatus Tectomicrobia bacterium]